MNKRCFKCGKAEKKDIIKMFILPTFSEDMIICSSCFNKYMAELIPIFDRLKNNNSKTPSHYQSAIQALDASRSWGLMPELNHAVKYIARAGKKKNVSFYDDIRKAKHYCELAEEAMKVQEVKANGR